MYFDSFCLKTGLSCSIGAAYKHAAMINPKIPSRGAGAKLNNAIDTQVVAKVNIVKKGNEFPLML